MSARTVDELLARLAELWCAERCDWNLHYDPAMYGRQKPGVTLMLTWTDEWGYGVLGEKRHGSDYTTFEWHFDGDTLHEAFFLAVSWLEKLVVWKVCDACDGAGNEYIKVDGQIVSVAGCGECEGTGLEAGLAALAERAS